MLNSKLDNKTIENIKSKARQKLLEYNKLNDVIGIQIFHILELQNKVLYYPIEDEEVWGFSEKIKGRSFVWINTAIDYDKQIFAAAHELYHLWFENESEVILKSDVEEIEDGFNQKENELIANRFAAEFLINEELLLQETRTYGINKNKLDLKDILKLSHLFVVPYKTMLRRLYEVDLLSKDEFTVFMNYSSDEIKIWRKRLGFSLPVRENKIVFDTLVDNAMQLYESKKITVQKLEYILGMSNLTLDQMNIKIEDDYIPPTDEELDKIMEE